MFPVTGRVLCISSCTRVARNIGANLYGKREEDEKIRLQRIPYALPPGPGTKVGLFGEEFLFLLINLTLARGKVNLVERNDFGFVVEFVASPQYEEGGDGDIGGNECIGLERDEGVVALEEGDDGGGDEGEV